MNMLQPAKSRNQFLYPRHQRVVAIMKGLHLYTTIVVYKTPRKPEHSQDLFIPSLVKTDYANKKQIIDI